MLKIVSKKIYILLLFLVLTHSGIAQSWVGSPGVTPGNMLAGPSPTAAGLGRFTQFPTITNTGVPSIGVPIWQMEENGFSVPIGLSYHARGIKVDQHASWVGMGWNLGAGGVITRSIRGIPDDVYDERGFWPSEGNEVAFRPWLEDRFNRSIAHEVEAFPDALTGGGSNPELYDYFAFEVLSEYIGLGGGDVFDSEPDIFFLNAPGLSAKFAFDNDPNSPQIRLIDDYQNLKIEYTLNNLFGTPENRGIMEFRVTNSAGITYVFAEREMTTTTVVTNVLDVNEMISTNTYVVAFQVNEVTTFPTAWYLSKIINPEGDEIKFKYESPTLKFRRNTVFSRYACSVDGTCEDLLPSNAYTDYSIKSKILQEIEGEFSRVRFINSAREDLEGGRKLDQIQIIAKENHDRIAYFDFNYTYRSNLAGIELIDNSTLYDNKRLYLTSLQQRGNSKATIRPYRFEYNITKLPNRLSFEQDYWGYYNNNGATSMIPEIYVYPNETGTNRYRIEPLNSSCNDPSCFHFPGADRGVTPGVIRAGMLEKITYPTGGYTEYQYEPNNYWDPDANQTFLGGGVRISQIRFHDALDPSKDMVKTYHYHQKDFSDRSSGVLVQQPRHAREIARTQDPDAGQLYLPSLGMLNITYFTDGDVQGISLKKTWDLFTQRYSVSQAPLSDLDGIQVQYTYVTIDHQGIGESEYEYYPPKNFRTNATMVNITSSGNTVVDLACSEESRIFGFIQQTGQNVYPYPPLSGNGLLTSGQLKSQTNKDENGNLTSSTQYDYQILSKNGLAPHKVQGLSHARAGGYCFYAPNRFKEASVPFHWARYELDTDADAVIDKKTERIYDKTGNYIETVTDYNYSTAHPGVILVKSINSDGSISENKSKYLLDYNNYIGATSPNEAVNTFQKFRDLHINPLIETWELIDGKVVTASYAEYERGIVNGRYLPQLKRRFELEIENPTSTFSESTFEAGTLNFLKSAQYELQAEINYNQKGNPVTLLENYNVPSYFIWDQQNRVIAEIFNGSTACAFTSFERDGQSDELYTPFAYPTNEGTAIKVGDAYTGQRYFDLSQGDITKQGLNASHKYIMDFWTKGDQKTVNVTSANPISVNSPSEWVFNRLLIEGQSSITISGDALIDELRIYPSNARMSSYTHRPMIGLTSENGSNGYTAKYHYDAFNRLEKVEDFEGNIVKTYDYVYGVGITCTNDFQARLDDDFIFKFSFDPACDEAQSGLIYEWDFGDGKTATSDRSGIIHVYPNNVYSHYDVTLVVRDPSQTGNPAIYPPLTKRVFVDKDAGNPNCVPDFNFSQYLTYSFDFIFNVVPDCNSTDLNLTAEWDFGDGTVITRSANETNISHRFEPIEQEHLVTLQLLDENGNLYGEPVTKRLLAQVDQTGASCTPDFTVNIRDDYNFDFTVSSDCQAGSLGLIFNWDFGNGAAATGASVNQTLPAGYNTVILTITDSQGNIIGEPIAKAVLSRTDS